MVWPETQLNKKVCQRCKGEWEHRDEHHWDELGDVYCPKKGGAICSTVTCSPPPSWCVYKLEHLVHRKEPFKNDFE